MNYSVKYFNFSIQSGLYPPTSLFMTSKERCHLCIIYAWIMHQWIVNHWIVYCELAQLLWTCIIPWKCMNTSISKISSLDCGFFCILILPANVFLIPRPSEVLQTPKLSILQEFFLNTPENSPSFLYTWPLEFPHAVFSLIDRNFLGWNSHGPQCKIK